MIVLRKMNYPGLKPWVSRVKDLKGLRFAPGGHSSPSLKARGFLAGFIKIIFRKGGNEEIWNGSIQICSPRGIFSLAKILFVVLIEDPEEDISQGIIKGDDHGKSGEHHQIGNFAPGEKGSPGFLPASAPRSAEHEA